jgi:putative transposase
MNYFSHLRPIDRVTFEGNLVENIIPLRNRETKEVTHYNLIVRKECGESVARKFSHDEIPELVEGEYLIIDKGFHSIARQNDRALYQGYIIS